MQCIFSDAGRVVLSVWTTEFVAVCIEVTYSAVSCECSCCTRVAALNEIVKNDGTLWRNNDEGRGREKMKKVE